MRNIKLTIAYDGTAYHGFQRQNNAVTVQQVVEEQLTRLFGHDIKVTGAARTDAKVHAYGQVVNFFSGASIPIEKIPIAVNSKLPNDIVITSAQEVADDFHARFSAKGKKYIYRIYQDKNPNPFLRNYAWYIRQNFDVNLINRTMKHIIGTHDFSAFRATGSTPTNPVRTILSAGCEQKENIITFAFHGTGFLYHMVRNLVGTLVDVGLNRTTVEEFKYIVMQRDRNLAGITAPGHGLYLKEVYYE